MSSILILKDTILKVYMYICLWSLIEFSYVRYRSNELSIILDQNYIVSNLIINLTIIINKHGIKVDICIKHYSLSNRTYYLIIHLFVAKKNFMPYLI